ncbi:MAG: hypothetical protein JGK21_17765 [Microcoleus sp. PH2017_22_RUC_O_B]|uniref:hypothetical protein n=1 Tax=unclassified Microcoleus TaxID=2642155 RepID=UPI001D43A365|nr:MULTISPECIES: hypothetical protein [unclassified Microcoleus]MCC3529889.1 hypothetical protein [Microcoleus sp. PH2017_21_RUC_O_A]MCC3542183.1 hypothetical protein [Microcoleus sp. PH2017_22_RUC_O_B]
MIPRRRLTDLEEILDSSYETLGNLQNQLAYTSGASERNTIKQTISRQVLPEISKYKKEYWQLLAQHANSFEINETDADCAIIEVLQIVEQTRQSNIAGYSQEAIQLLTEIRNKLNEPEKSAAGKLKATLPLMPPFISYEIELGTEGILQQIFPTFSRILKKK